MSLNVQAKASHSTIIQFTKAPVGDQVKTRLSSVLTVGQRLALHQAMTAWVFQQACQSNTNKIVLAIDGDCNHSFFQRLLADDIKTNSHQRKNELINVESESAQLSVCEITEQKGNDLGEKMLFSSIAEYNNSGADPVIILIGSDCPFITPHYLNAAIEALKTHSVVIGPACDGGYVLLGFKEIIPEMFNNIPWGTDQVFTLTCNILKKMGLDFKVLELMNDIDHPEDLELLKVLSKKTDAFDVFCATN